MTLVYLRTFFQSNLSDVRVNTRPLFFSRKDNNMKSNDFLSTHNSVT